MMNFLDVKEISECLGTIKSGEANNQRAHRVSLFIYTGLDVLLPARTVSVVVKTKHLDHI